MTTGTPIPRISSGVSSNPNGPAAAEHAAGQCRAGLGAASVDLCVVFASSAHVPVMEQVAEAVRRGLSPGCLIGVTGESIVGGAQELERTPAVSVLALSAPGAVFEGFTAENLTPVDESAAGVEAMAKRLGVDDTLRATLFFPDPYSLPLVKLMPAMSAAIRRRPGEAGDRRTPASLIGGLASAAKGPGGNRLVLNERVMSSGGVGVSIKGALHVDTVVSQGCRPFGPPMVITKARGNIIFQLAGRPALECVHEAVGDLPEGERQKLSSGLFIGRVINEYRERFGRGDFLIRNVMGVDQNTGAMAVGDLVRVGQTIRLHYRDAVTASEDLSLLLDAQKLYDRPAGALLVTSNSRGAKLFGRPNHDVAAVQRAFAPVVGGEELAKVGQTMGAASGTVQPLPVAGFFAAGEIGPIGGEGFVHTQSACVALFRPAFVVG